MPSFVYNVLQIGNDRHLKSPKYVYIYANMCAYIAPTFWDGLLCPLAHIPGKSCSYVCQQLGENWVQRVGPAEQRC